MVDLMSNAKTIRIIALTAAGRILAERLQFHIPEADIWFKPSPFAKRIQAAFQAGDNLIFICATGIVMRTLAPVLQNKHQDPPVLVMDELGQFVIPLLSGHEGGANNWAQNVATILAAQTVITTANAYLNPVYMVGMGCERDCPLSYLDSLLLKCLEQANVSIEQIDSIHSIDIKSDEKNLLALAAKYNKKFVTWRADELAPMAPLLSVKSDYVFNTVGVYGVAESACLLAVQKHTKAEPELLLTKQKNSKATCAIARGFTK